jgi:uncharacterized protein Yka (UPF0111/DUF47 family)
MFKAILPKEYAFFDYFDQIISLDKEIIDLFGSMMNENQNRIELSKQIKTLERQAEAIGRNCTDLLHRTFITPIERNDIFTLVNRLHSLADQINSAAFRVSAYDISDVRPEAERFSLIIQASINELIVAIRDLRKMKKKNQILQCCKKVHELENKADEIHRAAVLGLFQECDILLLIKWKEIFERLEKASDRCEDIACIIESILIQDS